MPIKTQIISFIFNKQFIILSLILLFAFFLRVYNLEVQYSNTDEYAQGYLAYRVLTTGTDHQGSQTNFKNLAGFKVKETYYESIAILFKIPFVYFFDLSIFAARLSSVIIGVITVFVFYLFLREYFKNTAIALLGSFLLAVSPWHISISRWALQAINVPLFLLLSLLFLFKYKNSKSLVCLYLFIIFAGSGIYTYPIFLPVIFLLFALFFLCYNKLFKNNTNNKPHLIKNMIIPLIIFFIFCTPFLLNIDDLTARAKGENIFNKEFTSGNPLILFLKSYFSQINLINYFFRAPDFYVASSRLEYLILFPFLVIGIIIALFIKKDYFLIGCYLLGAIPQSFTRIGNVVHPNRSIQLDLIILIFAALGIYHTAIYLKNKQRFLFVILLSAILFFEAFSILPGAIYSESETSMTLESFTPELLTALTEEFISYDKFVFESCINDAVWEYIIPFYFYTKSDEKHLPSFYYKFNFCYGDIFICINKNRMSLNNTLYVLCNNETAINFNVLKRIPQTNTARGYFLATANDTIIKNINFSIF